MIFKICQTCKGDGFYRIAKKDAYPELNIAPARLIRRPGPSSGDALLDYYDSIVAYEYDCMRCRGAGEIRWSRGKSLMPTTSQTAS